jgi:hypothetical protein
MCVCIIVSALRLTFKSFEKKRSSFRFVRTWPSAQRTNIESLRTSASRNDKKEKKTLTATSLRTWTETPIFLAVLYLEGSSVREKSCRRQRTGLTGGGGAGASPSSLFSPPSPPINHQSKTTHIHPLLYSLFTLASRASLVSARPRRTLPWPNGGWMGPVC